MRVECSLPLLKPIKTASGKQFSVPSIICYRSVIHALEQFVQRPGILDTFNHWRNRNIPTGVLADVMMVWYGSRSLVLMVNSFFRVDMLLVS